jgi:hypothetical protein
MSMKLVAIKFLVTLCSLTAVACGGAPTGSTDPNVAVDPSMTAPTSNPTDPPPADTATPVQTKPDAGSPTQPEGDAAPAPTDDAGSPTTPVDPPEGQDAGAPDPAVDAGAPADDGGSSTTPPAVDAGVDAAPVALCCIGQFKLSTTCSTTAITHGAYCEPEVIGGACSGWPNTTDVPTACGVGPEPCYIGVIQACAQ